MGGDSGASEAEESLASSRAGSRSDTRDSIESVLDGSGWQRRRVKRLVSCKNDAFNTSCTSPSCVFVGGGRCHVGVQDGGAERYEGAVLQRVGSSAFTTKEGGTHTMRFPKTTGFRRSRTACAGQADAETHLDRAVSVAVELP